MQFELNMDDSLLTLQNTMVHSEERAPFQLLHDSLGIVCEHPFSCQT